MVSSKALSHRVYCPPRYRKTDGINTSNQGPINMDAISGKLVSPIDGDIEKSYYKYTDDEIFSPEQYHQRQKGYI